MKRLAIIALVAVALAFAGCAALTSASDAALIGWERAEAKRAEIEKAAAEVEARIASLTATYEAAKAEYERQRAEGIDPTAALETVAKVGAELASLKKEFEEGAARKLAEEEVGFWKGEYEAAKANEDSGGLPAWAHVAIAVLGTFVGVGVPALRSRANAKAELAVAESAMRTTKRSVEASGSLAAVKAKQKENLTAEEAAFVRKV